MTNHIVVTRPGYEPCTTDVGAAGERIVDLRGAEPAVRRERGTKIFFTDVVMKDVSATNIRRLAKEGRTEELTGLLPGPVLEYIKKYGIYRELNEAKLNS
jgi:nicotinic acid mononucleotide adenylyltransferase